MMYYESQQMWVDEGGEDNDIVWPECLRADKLRSVRYDDDETSK